MEIKPASSTLNRDDVDGDDDDDDDDDSKSSKDSEPAGRPADVDGCDRQCPAAPFDGCPTLCLSLVGPIVARPMMAMGANCVKERHCPCPPAIQ